MQQTSVVIVGAGQAGARATDTLRRNGFAGRLVLVGDESGLPHQRPPLSKGFLSGDLPQDRLPFRHQAFYDEHRVELMLGVRATHLDLAAHCLNLSTGQDVQYDRLLLCTGSTARELTCPGAELPG